MLFLSRILFFGVREGYNWPIREIRASSLNLKCTNNRLKQCVINVEKAIEGVHFFFNGILNSTFISNKHVFLCKTVL